MFFSFLVFLGIIGMGIERGILAVQDMFFHVYCCGILHRKTNFQYFIDWCIKFPAFRARAVTSFGLIGSLGLQSYVIGSLPVVATLYTLKQTLNILLTGLLRFPRFVCARS